MKIISWNVNGIRAVMKKDFKNQFLEFDADVLCLQETKAQVDQVNEALNWIEGYHIFANHAERKGYSGTAIISKTKPISVTYDIGNDNHDNEGRVICAEYEDFFVVTVYVPNSGNDLRRLDYRQSWDADFLLYLKELENKKPVIVNGDFNVAHKAIDLARPKPNYNKSAGFMQEEIDGMDNYTKSGLLDSFRVLNPEKEESYTWWSYRGGARERNVGWRIDYFLLSEILKDKLKDAFILNDYMGSDHCPVGIEI